MPLKCQVYSLSVPESKAKYVEEALATWYIQPSTPSTAEGFFFMEKKDRLHPCIDYQMHHGALPLTHTTCPSGLKPTAGSTGVLQIGLEKRLQPLSD